MILGAVILLSVTMKSHLLADFILFQPRLLFSLFVKVQTFFYIHSFFRNISSSFTFFIYRTLLYHANHFIRCRYKASKTKYKVKKNKRLTDEQKAKELERIDEALSLLKAKVKYLTRSEALERIKQL